MLAEFLSFLIMVPLAILSWRAISVLLVGRFPRAATAINSAT